LVSVRVLATGLRASWFLSGLYQDGSVAGACFALLCFVYSLKGVLFTLCAWLLVLGTHHTMVHFATYLMEVP